MNSIIVKSLACTILFIVAPAFADGGRECNNGNLCECVTSQNWGNGSYYNWFVYKRGKLVKNGNAELGENRAQQVCRGWTVTSPECYEANP